MNPDVTQLPAVVAGAVAAVAFAAFAAAVYRERAPREDVGAALLFLAIGIYMGGLLDRFRDGTFQLLLPADLYGISGMVLALAGLYVARFRRVPSLWATVSAVAALFFLAGRFAHSAVRTEDAPETVLLTLHVGLVLCAAGFLLLLGLLALLYVAKEQALTRDPTGWSRRLPNLELLDRGQVRSMQVGFLLLTLGMTFGLVLWFSVPAPSARADFLAAATFAVWVLLGGLLYLRLWRQWRGHRLAVLSSLIVGGLLVAIVATFGVDSLRHGGA